MIVEWMEWKKLIKRGVIDWYMSEVWVECGCNMGGVRVGHWWNMEEILMEYWWK